MNALAYKNNAALEVAPQNEILENFLLEANISVADLMQAPIEMLKIQAESKNIDLCYEATKAKIDMKVDVQKIRHSLIHIVQSAIKYSDASATVYVSTGRDFNGDFYIRVDDEGKGIATPILERILQPFTTVENGLETSHSHKGAGLNLINAYLKMHFGYLRVQSQVGRGTNVTITLPKSCILSR